MNTTLSHIILFCLLFLSSYNFGPDNRSFLQVECFDISGKLIHKEKTRDFYVAGIRPGEPSGAHKCVITETNER